MHSAQTPNFHNKPVTDCREVIEFAVYIEFMLYLE